MTTTSPRPPASQGTGEDEAAAIMAAATRPVILLERPAAAAVQAAAAALIAAAGAGAVLAAGPGAARAAVVAACLAVIAARVLLPPVARETQARRPAPWTAAASILEAGHPSRLPAPVLDAARRRLPAMAAARRQARAWLYIAPCTGTCTRLCQGAATLPLAGRLLVVLGAHPAADPAAAPFLLAHEAGHATGWTWRALAVLQPARAAGGPGWAAAGAAGAALAGWPGAIAAALIFHAASLAGLWAVEIGCDRRAARDEGPAAARAALDHATAAVAAISARRGRPARAALAVLALAAGPSHPPLAMRRALAVPRDGAQPGPLTD